MSNRLRLLRIRDQRGFSLIELVLTIVIIGILATVAVARYINLTDASKKAACITNQLTLESAETMYYSENYVRFGTAGYASNLADLSPYLVSNSVPQCPNGYTYRILSQGRIECPDPDHARQ